jgi:hypothetical protein
MEVNIDGTHVKEKDVEQVPYIRSTLNQHLWKEIIVGTSAHSITSAVTNYQLYKPDYMFVETCFFDTIASWEEFLWSRRTYLAWTRKKQLGRKQMEHILLFLLLEELKVKTVIIQLGTAQMELLWFGPLCKLPIPPSLSNSWRKEWRRRFGQVWNTCSRTDRHIWATISIS